MTSIERLLDQSLSADSLALPETFQGFPGMAHGGSVLAAFDALGRRRGAAGPREIFGHYRRKVPLNTPLRIEVLDSEGGIDFRLSDETHRLVEGRVRPGAVPARGPEIPGDPSGGFPLPISSSCFACGIKNFMGLQAALRFDDRRVWAEYVPREPFRTDDGRLSTAVLTTLLDEAAYWLGALDTGESGMTTELRVTLHRDAIGFGEPLIVIGERERVGQGADDPRYRTTEPAILTANGELLATGRITFVVIKGAAKRLVTGILAVNPPEVLRRIFPGYVP